MNDTTVKTVSVVHKTGTTRVVQTACTTASVRRNSCRCDLVTPMTAINKATFTSGTTEMTLTRTQYYETIEEHYAS